MKKLFAVLSVMLLLGASQGYAAEVKISQPADGSSQASPVEVCLEASGVTVEPAKNGVNEGKGHHHLLIDVDLPADLSKPIGKDDQHVHMGDGSVCKKLDLKPGKHTIQALFAKGDHVPYNPPLLSLIHISEPTRRS